MSPPLLEVGAISKSFRRGGRSIVALDGASLELERGETLALVGPSGSGKSTLARIVMRLVEPDFEPVSGAIRFDGIDLLAARGEALRLLRPRFQMVFQEPLAAFNPRATVAGVLDDPLRIHRLADRRKRPAAIAALLERVGLDPGLAGRRVHEISGGQRQRVAIARAIATQPALIVLDEAVSALDVTVRAGILALLDDLRRNENLGLLFISHDLAVVAAFADRIAIMDGGRIVETGRAAAIIAEPQSATGKALVAAMPRLRIGESMQ
jgi:peptide/nickel transport system ATP-binding protein